MAEHGTRACYQKGCRQLTCRAAEARYRANLRATHRTGKLPLGARVPAKEAWILIRRLKLEHFKKQDIAARLGLRSRKLRLHYEAVTVRNLLKLRRLAREVLWEPASDSPDAG